MPDNPASHVCDALNFSSTMGAAGRIQVVESLVPVAIAEVAAQLEGVTGRLADAMLRLSDQCVLPEDAVVSFKAWNHLTKNASQLQRGILGSLGQALFGEIAVLETTPSSNLAQTPFDLTRISPDDIEGRILIGNFARDIELDHAAALVALNIRLGRLLQRESISIALNPFRPAVFLRAVYAAWCRFDRSGQSHLLVLRLLRARVFVDFAPLLSALNGALVARGIVPDLLATDGDNRLIRSPSRPAGHVVTDAALRRKLEGWFDEVTGEPVAALDVTASVCGVSSGSLRSADRNTIALLARMWEVLFSDPDIPAHARQLLTRLQVPLLRTALVDREFFFSSACPARRLLEQLLGAGRGLHHAAYVDDPLCRLIQTSIDKAQREIGQHSGVVDTVVADLDAYLLDADETENSLLQPYIDEALHQEKVQQAHVLAKADVACRIESGAVAGFVEVFLETQWTRVLMLARSVASHDPRALEQALQTMDKLIWSVAPKISLQERTRLLSQLPALLTQVNTWLDMISWKEPARCLFFSRLAQCHAATVRLSTGYSPRQQIELAVHVAQKASERRLGKRVRAMHEPALDQFVHEVDSIEQGNWVKFASSNGRSGMFRLAWISPLRTRFIFSNRHSEECFASTAQELALALREQQAHVLPRESVIARALHTALGQASPCGVVTGEV
jgi:hypothetical protein